MYERITWNQQELELIETALATPARWFALRPLRVLRENALERYNEHLRAVTAEQDYYPLQRADFNRHAFDLLTVKDIRHRHTNYGEFWEDEQIGHLRSFLWLIGFLKVEQMMMARYPVLADAISLEMIKRIGAKERALLRETILNLTDRATVEIPGETYAELQAAAAGRLSKRRSTEKTISNKEEWDERVREEVVDDFIKTHCEPQVVGLGAYLLHIYHLSVIRERVTRRALITLSDHFSELAAVCQNRIEALSKITDRNTIIKVGTKASVIYSPPIKRVLARTVNEYNDAHHESIRKGKVESLYLEGAPEAFLTKVRALAVHHILSKFSRYEELKGIAATLPEPMASDQANKIRQIFLEKIQERYPELTDAVQTELRLLPPRLTAAIAS